MKGISSIIGYTLALLISVIVVSGVAVLVLNIQNQVVEDQVRRDLGQVASQTSEQITELYTLTRFSKTSPGSSSSVLLADVSLNLPSKVASKSYKIGLLSASDVLSQIENVTVDGENVTTQNIPPLGKIVAETTEEPFVSVEYDIPSIGIDFQGSVGDPANATLKYYRYNPNGTVVDVIVLGDPDLIGQITQVG